MYLDISSLLEMANSSLSKNDVEHLVESMCQQQGLTSEDSINFDDFCTILSPHMDKLWNTGLEWKGCKNFLPVPNDEKRKRYGTQNCLISLIVCFKF